MCGIAGILNIDNTPVSSHLLDGMTQSLTHRGPDGSGIQIWDKVGIGHRRLAIIDVKGGNQPLSNEDGLVWITYNGEIYNYRDLRNQLEGRGHVFRTQSDTETIVHAYEEWEDDCVKHLRGMFSFAIVDMRQSRLFLARDHLGIKPLYYAHCQNFFAFASELQALKQLPDLRPELDLEAMDQYLWLQYIPAPKTIYRQVRKLPPAHHMAVTFGGKMKGPQEYWQLKFKPDHTRTESEWVETFEAVLRDSVRAHLVSEVPFGAFLSGGVDSSAVVAFMAQTLEQAVNTFTIGFQEEDFSEIDFAKQVADQWHTEHHTEIVKPDALAILPDLVRHYGEPFGDSSALPTFYLSRMARQFVPMVLSGDGGDESLAGYDSYRSWMRWLEYDSTPRWKQRLRPIAQTLLPKRYPPHRPTLRNWLQFIEYTRFSQRSALWRPEFQNVQSNTLETFEQEFMRTSDESPSHIAQHMDLKTYLPYDILTKVDVASMMHGLEVRTPLVDVQVVEFASTLPQSMTLRRNEKGDWEGKWLMKKLLERFYPSPFLNRRKMGFAVPLQKWFAPEGPLRKELEDRLLGADSPLSQFFLPRGIVQLFGRSAPGPLWLLLFLDEWLRQNQSRVSC
jgi:asparagine synthase (glutamine-hydrolysing)